MSEMIKWWFDDLLQPRDHRSASALHHNAITFSGHYLTSWLRTMLPYFTFGQTLSLLHVKHTCFIIKSFFETASSLLLLTVTGSSLRVLFDVYANCNFTDACRHAFDCSSLQGILMGIFSYVRCMISEWTMSICQLVHSLKNCLIESDIHGTL